MERASMQRVEVHARDERAPFLVASVVGVTPALN